MENLGHDVVDTTLDVVSGPACPIKKTLPVLLPVVAVLGVGFLIVKVVKRNKAKKVAALASAEEVNPEV